MGYTTYVGLEMFARLCYPSLLLRSINYTQKRFMISTPCCTSPSGLPGPWPDDLFPNGDLPLHRRSLGPYYLKSKISLLRLIAEELWGIRRNFSIFINRFATNVNGCVVR